MKTKTKLSKSARKHIREEKPRIRREFPDTKEQKEQIGELYAKFLPKTENKHEKDEEVKQKDDKKPKTKKPKVSKSKKSTEKPKNKKTETATK